MDECEIHTHPTLAKVWRRRGQPLRIPAAGDDHKCAVFGGLDYASGRLIHHIDAHKDEDTFMTFLDELAHLFPKDEPIVVVLDNASYHKSHAVQEWWRAHADQFQPFFLPAYSPQLNLIERLWRYLKDKRACHRWWDDLQRLQQVAQFLLTGLQVHFHATEGPAFRPLHNFRETA